MPTTFDCRPEGGRTALRLKKPDKHPLILAYIWRDANGVYHAKDVQLRLKRPPAPSKYFFEFLEADARRMQRRNGLETTKLHNAKHIQFSRRMPRIFAA